MSDSSRKISLGSQSLFGRVSLSKLGKTGAGRIRNGLDQISDFTRTYKLRCLDENSDEREMEPSGVGLDSRRYREYDVSGAAVYVPVVQEREIFDNFDQKFESTEPERSVQRMNEVVSIVPEMPKEAEPAEESSTDYSYDSYAEPEADVPEPVEEEPTQLREIYNVDDYEPDIIKQEPSVPDDGAKEELEVNVPAVAPIKEEEELPPESLFGALIHKHDTEVIAHRGIVTGDGYIKETGPAEQNAVSEADIIEMEMAESIVDNKVIEAKDTHLDAERQPVDTEGPIDCSIYAGETREATEDEFLYVERAEPKLEDFISSQAPVAAEAERELIGPAPSVMQVAVREEPDFDAEAVSEAFIDCMAMMPEEEYASITEVSSYAWDVDNDTAEAFRGFISIRPQYPKKVFAMPAWDLTEEASEALIDYQAIEPEFEETAPVVIGWDLTEEVAETYCDYLSIWPQYPRKEKPMAAWDITDDTAEIYNDYMAIKPEFQSRHKVPDFNWNVPDEAAEIYTDYLSIWPQYPRKEKPMAAWDITEETSEAFNDYMTIKPEFQSRHKVPDFNWSVSEETSETYRGYLSIWPSYPRKEKPMAAWDITEDTAEIYNDFQTMRIVYPRKQMAAWDITEETSETYSDYLSIWPQYPRKEKPMAAWDISEETSEAFNDYMAIKPEFQSRHKAPDFNWRISDEAAETFTDYLSIWPSYPRKEKPMAAWDITEDTAEIYNDFQTMRIVYPRQVPVWSITAEAAEAFNDYMAIKPEFPKRQVPEFVWDTTENAAESFVFNKREEAEIIRQAELEAIVQVTISSKKIDVEELGPRKESLGAAAGVPADHKAQQIDVTGDAKPVEKRMRIVGDGEVVRIKPQTVIEKRKAKPSRFVFKDGKLQKVVDTVDLPEVKAPVSQTTITEIAPLVEEPGMEVTVTVEEPKEERMMIAPCEEVIRLPAAKTEAISLPEPEVRYALTAGETPKKADGVSFTFGGSQKTYGSIRFMF